MASGQSTMLWSQAVRAAEAHDALDAPTRDAGAAALLAQKKAVAYEFSNGRKFEDGQGPYE